MYEIFIHIYIYIYIYTLRVPTFAANSMAKLELGLDSMTGKVVGTFKNYWLHLLCMDSQEIQVHNDFSIYSWHCVEFYSADLMVNLRTLTAQ
jgi:hypothetical protein